MQLILPLDFFEVNKTIFCMAMRGVLAQLVPGGPQKIEYCGDKDDRYHYFVVDQHHITVDTRYSDITVSGTSAIGISNYGYNRFELGDLRRNIKALTETIVKKHDAICHNEALAKRLLAISDLIEAVVNDCHLTPDLATWMQANASQTSTAANPSQPSYLGS